MRCFSFRRRASYDVRRSFLQLVLRKGPFCYGANIHKSSDPNCVILERNYLDKHFIIKKYEKIVFSVEQKSKNLPLVVEGFFRNPSESTIEGLARSPIPPRLSRKETSACCLKRRRDHTAPIEICGVPVGTEPEQENIYVYQKTMQCCDRGYFGADTRIGCYTIFSKKNKFSQSFCFYCLFESDRGSHQKQPSHSAQHAPHKQ